jgi:imidazolonepropionase-like amidohydrolase
MHAPSALVAEFMPDLIQLVAQGRHVDEIRGLMGARQSTDESNLMRAVDAALNATTPTLVHFQHLATFLKSLNARMPFQKVVDLMLSSGDAAIRAAGENYRQPPFDPAN